MRWRTAKNHRRSAERKYQRRLAKGKKVSRLGLSYGMSMRRMADNLRGMGIAAKDAEEAVQSFRRQYLRGQKHRLRFHSAVSGRMVMHTDGTVTTKRWPGLREDEPK